KSGGIASVSSFGNAVRAQCLPGSVPMLASGALSLTTAVSGKPSQSRSPAGIGQSGSPSGKPGHAGQLGAGASGLSYSSSLLFAESAMYTLPEPSIANPPRGDLMLLALITPWLDESVVNLPSWPKTRSASVPLING